MHLVLCSRCFPNRAENPAPSAAKIPDAMHLMIEVSALHPVSVQQSGVSSASYTEFGHEVRSVKPCLTQSEIDVRILAFHGLNGAHKDWTTSPVAQVRLMDNADVCAWLRFCCVGPEDNAYVLAKMATEGSTAFEWT